MLKCKKRQRGFVLVVVLMVLSGLDIMVLSGMELTRLQMKMVNGWQRQLTVFDTNHGE